MVIEASGQRRWDDGEMAEQRRSKDDGHHEHVAEVYVNVTKERYQGRRKKVDVSDKVRFGYEARLMVAVGFCHCKICSGRTAQGCMQPCRHEVGAEANAMSLERRSPPHARAIASRTGKRALALTLMKGTKDQESRLKGTMKGNLRPAKGPWMEIE